MRCNGLNSLWLAETFAMEGLLKISKELKTPNLNTYDCLCSVAHNADC